MDSISVCSITHNQRNFVKTLVESVRDQSLPAMEHIIIDDCSTDGTWEELSSYGGLRLTKNYQNCGAASSLDSAISRGNGEYTAILEGDDYFKPSKLRDSLDFLKENNYDLICTDIDDLYEDGRIVERGWGAHGYNVPRELTLDYLKLDNRIYTSTILAKSAILKSSPGFDGFGYKIIGDYPNFLWLAARYKIGYLDQNLTVKRYVSSSLGKQLGAAEEYGRQKREVEQIISYEKH